MDKLDIDYSKLDPKLAEVLRNMPNEALNSIGKMIENGGGLSFSNDVYWSRVRLPLTVTGSAPYVYSLARGSKSLAFSYGIGDSMTTAGYASGYGVANLSDTNLVNKAEVNDSGLFIINGIALALDPRNDPQANIEILPEQIVTCGFGGDFTRNKLGSAFFFPGGQGLAGGGVSNLRTPNLGDVAAIVPSTQDNGLQGALNYKVLDDPIMWFPKGSGNREVNFNVQFETARDISFSATARSAGTGIAAFAPPTTTGARGTYCDITVKLYGWQFSNRSKNS